VSFVADLFSELPSISPGHVTLDVNDLVVDVTVVASDILRSASLDRKTLDLNMSTNPNG